MKNKTNLMKFAFALATVCALPAIAGCGKKSTITQLYVLNYQGGYGKKWLENAATRYEEMYKDTSFEEGKTGIDIIVKEEKTAPNMASLKNSNYGLVCFEGMVYQELVDNQVCADITQYVTGENKYDNNKTIESKMFDDQKNFFKDNGVYYMLPNYVGSFGIVYNKTVFKNYKFYFAKDYQEKDPGTDDRFTGTLNFRSVGPDGKTGVIDGVDYSEDDGLPVTYEEFYELCDYIDSKSLTPLIWLGKGSENYLTDLTSAMIANYDGADAYKANYLMDGTFKAVKLDDSNKSVLLKEGVPETEDVTVHPDKVNDKYDGFEIQRSASKYYAFDFMRKLADNELSEGSQKGEGKWKCDRVNGSLLMTEAQEYFIQSQFGKLPTLAERKKNNPIAMMFEGNWWESEASAVFNTLSDAQKAELDYGWMPLPRHITATNTKYTTLNSLTSYMFVKSGLPEWKTKLAADFLQYLNTDEAYQEFTELTSAIKSFKYTMSDTSKAKMTKFGQSFWNYFERSDKIFPESHNEQFVKYLASSQLSRRYCMENGVITWPSLTFENPPAGTRYDAGTYLYKMYNHYKNDIWKQS